MITRACFVVVVCILVGCADYNLTPISMDEAQHAHNGPGVKEGYIFYAPKPYLVGTYQGLSEDTEEPIYKFELRYLPDYSKPFRFTRNVFLSKFDLDIAFEDGWQFTGAKSKSDTTAALAELVKLAEAGAKFIPLDEDPSGKKATPQFIFFEITADSQGRPKIERVTVDGDG